MLPLRFRRRWYAASAALLLVVLALGIAPVVWPDVGGRALLRHVDKYAHFLTFATLAVWFCGQYARRAYWRIAVGLLTYGILIEWLQRIVGYRSADVYDVAANLSGILLGLVIGWTVAGGWSQSFERWMIERRAG